MPKLVHQRCLHHTDREAASRCPSCRMFFCRECVTEHNGRVLCRKCLVSNQTSAGSSRVQTWLAWTVFGTGGFLFAWAVLYYIGGLLSRMPAQFRGVSH